MQNLGGSAKISFRNFVELPKFCPEPHRGSGQPRTELCSGTGLHFEF